MKPRDQIGKRESGRSTNRVDAMIRQHAMPYEATIISSLGTRTVIAKVRAPELLVSSVPGRSGRRRRQRRKQRKREG